MSTLKTTNLQHASAGSPAIVLDADGDAAYAGTHDFSAATVTGIPVTQGLTLVNATTFTSETSINLDNVFTSDYLNYRIIWQGVSVAGSALNARLRVSGADNTAAQYDSTIVYGGTGLSSPSLAQTSASTSWQYNVSGVVYNTIVADIFSPNIATPTLANATSLQTDAAGTRYLITQTQVHRASTAFDGYNIFLSQSTTGTVRVYGYSDGA